RLNAGGKPIDGNLVPGAAAKSAEETQGRVRTGQGRTLGSAETHKNMSRRWLTQWLEMEGIRQSEMLNVNTCRIRTARQGHRCRESQQESLSVWNVITGVVLKQREGVLSRCLVPAARDLQHDDGLKRSTD
ncbi:unnamed protein product, partial [Mycena citricolor]